MHKVGETEHKKKQNTCISIDIFPFHKDPGEHLHGTKRTILLRIYGETGKGEKSRKKKAKMHHNIARMHEFRIVSIDTVSFLHILPIHELQRNKSDAGSLTTVYRSVLDSQTIELHYYSNAFSHSYFNRQKPEPTTS